MSKTIKYKDNTYLDSSGVVFEKTSLDKILTYSTEEQVVGKWINGKTLYRKTLFTSLNSSTSGELGSINDVDYINVVNGCTIFINGSNTYYVPISTYETSTNFSKFFIQKNTSTNKANIKWAGNSTTGTIYATVEYTKTTD